jgi:Kef-type K+ transport system membrane component KefB
MVELVALDIGRTLGILSPALFTMFVIMTLVTTLATVPILRRLGLRPIEAAAGE